MLALAMPVKTKKTAIENEAPHIKAFGFLERNTEPRSQSGRMYEAAFEIKYFLDSA